MHEELQKLKAVFASDELKAKAEAGSLWARFKLWIKGLFHK